MKGVSRSDSIVAHTITEAREGYGLSMRGLAEKASLSAAQISRIERGLVEQPSMDTLAAIAKALDRNPIPLWIVAGHLQGKDAIQLLREMLSPEAEIFDEWGDRKARASALALVTDPNPDRHDLSELAAKVFKTFETEETLWDTYAHRLGREPVASEFGTAMGHLQASRRSVALLEIARHLPEGRLAKLVEYARDQFEAEFARPFLGADVELEEELEEARMRVAVAEEPDDGPFTRVALERKGFEGFLTVAELRRSKVAQVPRVAGVYAVLTADHSGEFLEANPGGRFKQRDPSVSMSLLKAKWLDRSTTVYIGKGNSLRQRIKQFVDFGEGKPVGHWGGRYIWQLANADELIVAWIRSPEGVEARALETNLLDEFAAEFGTLPFANLTR